MSAPNELLIFQQTVEGLFRALGPELSREVAPRLKQAGIDPANLLPAYPLPTWVAAVEIAAEAVSPGTSREEAVYQLGRRYLDGYAGTLIGRALLSMLKILGPARTLQRMTKNFRTANNYTETRLTEVGPQHYELWCSHVVHADYYRGLIEGALERTGATHPSARVAGRPDGGALFQVRWQ